MKIRKDFEIALSVLTTLKNRFTPTRASDLANELGESVAFMDQVLRKLRIAGFVTVQRGPGGGFTLSSRSLAPNAFEVAKAIGTYKTPKTTLSADSAQGRLQKAIEDAYLNTTV